MATLRELIIKISANSSSFQSEISRASRMGADYYKTMEQGGRRAAAASRESQRALTELNSQLASVRATATGMAGAFAGAFATGQLIHYADTWNQLSGRLKLASTSTEDFTSAQKTLMDVSQRTGTSFEANANLYSRIASSLRDAGYASQDVAKVTETVATSLKLSGASTEEASSVITQLSQALGSGVLRGEEFNAIMENGGRLAKLLATGLNTTIGGLRNMANNGQLTTDKLIPILTNVELLRKEFDTLPASVSGSAQKVENAFMAWVGGTNETTGASAALAHTLDGLAGNINNVATAAGVLVAVGVARYFGGVTSGVASATAALLENRRNQIALADAQAVAAVQAQRKALANAEAARSDYNLALAESNVAKNTNASALATQNLTQKRSAMIAANANLVLSNRAVTTSQESLNAATSAVGLMKTAGAGLLSLVGGIPGLVLLGAGAWYTMYQNQEQARKSAQEYGSTIDEVRKKAQSLALPQVDENRGKTIEALNEQNRLIDEQKAKVAEVKQQMADLSSARGSTGLSSENEANITRAMAILTGNLRVEEERLYQLRGRSADIQQALEAIERRRNDLIREQAWRQNAAYQSLVSMNGENTEFNRLLSLGNQLLASRNGLVRSPMAVPQAAVSAPDQQTLQQKQQAAELAGLTGLAKVRKQAQFDLEKMGRTGVENAKYSMQYVKALEDEYNNTQKVSEAKKSDTSATNAKNKAEREAATTAEQYSRKIADLSVAIEVQKVRATQGEKASELYAASHQAGTKWTEEQRKSIRDNATELERWTQKADANVKKQNEQAEALKDLTQAARKLRDESTLTTETRGLSDRQRSRFDETQQINRVFDKTDKGTQAVAAQKAALDELDAKYKAIAAADADWRSGISKGYENWLESVSNVSGTVSQGITSTMSSALDNMSSMLVSSKADWKSWGLSVLQMISKVALQIAVVNAVGSSGSSLGSIFGSVAGSFGGVAAGSAGAASTGAMGLATSYTGYDGGGFTGWGGKHEPAGVVHKGEFVFTKEATERIGVSNLYSMMKGYADGGVVGNGTPAFSSGVDRAGGNGGGIVVNASVSVVQGEASGDASASGTLSAAKQLKGIVETTLTERIKKEISPGGLLYRPA
ncbi:phage tail tape measure protein [Pantoea ananatis]